MIAKPADAGDVRREKPRLKPFVWPGALCCRAVGWSLLGIAAKLAARRPRSRSRSMLAVERITRGVASVVLCGAGRLPSRPADAGEVPARRPAQAVPLPKRPFLTRGVG